MIAQILLALALIAPAPHQAPAAASKPCIGVIVRADIAGVEIVRQANGKLCSRPAGGSPQKMQVKQ